jgi:hypothetical protein
LALRQSPHVAGIAALLVGLLSPSPARATPCKSGHAKAADVDWAYWNGAGIAFTPRAYATFALGFESTLSLFCYTGYPAGHRGNLAEVRFGPWVMAERAIAAGLIEGGLKVHVGAIDHAQWGTYDLRLGAGYGGWDADHRHPHAVVTLAWGARAYPGRRRRVYYDPPGISVELARPWRLFGTYRRALDGSTGHELVFGIEITPAFALPPHDHWQFIGDNSR